MSRDECEHEISVRGMFFEILNHTQKSDCTVFFAEVASVGVSVDYDCFVGVFFAFYDCVERLRVGVFERTREFESRALFRFCGFEHRLSVLFVYPNHRHFEIVKDKVKHLSFDHLVGHIFPNANHAFHARQLRRPEGEQSFDERRADGASVTLFDFEVARQGFALVKSDFTAYFRKIFNVANGNFASCSLEAERVISDYDKLSADAVFACKSAVREGG